MCIWRCKTGEFDPSEDAGDSWHGHIAQVTALTERKSIPFVRQGLPTQHTIAALEPFTKPNI